MEQSKMNEHRTIFPILGEVLFSLNIDSNVSPDEMYGVAFTAADLDRAYHRWKNVMEAPDPKETEMTDQLYLTLWSELEEVAKELTEKGHKINELKQHAFNRVVEVSKLELQIHILEQKVSVLTADQHMLKGLTNSRESEIKKLQNDIKNADKLIERYDKKYKTLDVRLNWLQRIAAFIFRI